MTERTEIQPESREDWRAWLEQNHATSDTIWLTYWKKSSGRQGLSYAHAVEEALCFGWIDAQVQSIDEQRYGQLFSGRKPRSVWSALNKRRLEALIADGRMAPAGLRAIELAKANGSWTSIDAIEALEVPAELEKALAKRPALKRFFDSLSPSNRKGFLYFIGIPRTPEAKARRLEVALTLLANGETLQDYYFAKDAAKKLAEKAGAKPVAKTKASAKKKASAPGRAKANAKTSAKKTGTTKAKTKS